MNEIICTKNKQLPQNNLTLSLFHPPIFFNTYEQIIIEKLQIIFSPMGFVLKCTGQT